ncbi:HelD family protein [Kineococcus sp. SYSU DK001]|uniref:HelD family protein n=1 Tax=Kineococcus sp. SYSU DK001 TaxID=3383122 RepID=UPI003D7C476F
MDSRDEEQRFLDTFHTVRRTEVRDREQQLRRLLENSPRAARDRPDHEANVRRLRRRVDALRNAEDGLCFGRLDLEDGTVLHVGRVGLPDDRWSPLLVDWRAAAARPFYTATAATPEGVRRRRQIATRRDRVLAVEEELLTPRDRDRADGPVPPALTATLSSVLDLPRTGLMRDVVATIAAEQDEIVRDRLPGVLVVQGGPGTGKTAVALHRAAYLLYTHRELLEGRGVLFVGPSSTFLRYVSRVLPALGETSVLMVTPARLSPGLEVEVGEAADPPPTRQLKGTPEMARLVAGAVADRQEVPVDPVELDLAGFGLVVPPHLVAGCRDRARAAGLPHNRARPVFTAHLLEAVTAEYARQLGADPHGGPNLLGDGDVEELRAEVREAPDVHALADRCWPVLTPQRLLRELYACPERLRRAAPDLDPRRRDLLRRSPNAPFTVADVPLLDEAAELLGPGPQEDADRVRRRREAEERRAYARGVLEVLHGSRSLDLDDDDDDTEDGVEGVEDVEDVAALLAERYGPDDDRSTAERAATDRGWAFGHVVVDEAQELTPMQWRVLARRCPTRSMTLVGDLHQAGSPGAPTDWEQVRAWIGAADDPRHWRVRHLTTSYRTPQEVLDVAAAALRRADPAARPPRAVRRSGFPVVERTAPAGELPHRAAETAAGIAAAGPGTVAVIAPAPDLPPVRRAVAEALGPERHERVSVLTARQAQGLEFDHVVLLDPDRIARGPGGHHDLYVALTRATRRVVQLRPCDDGR